MWAQMRLIEIQQDKYNDGPYVLNEKVNLEDLERRLNQETILIDVNLNKLIELFIKKEL